MAIIKDIVLTAFCIVLFCVMLCFIQLHDELRTSVVQNDITINSQTRIIQDSLEAEAELRFKIQCLKIEIMDLREVLLVQQKRETVAGSIVKELRLEVTGLERVRKRLLYKIEKLEKEIKDVVQVPETN